MIIVSLSVSDVAMQRGWLGCNNSLQNRIATIYGARWLTVTVVMVAEGFTMGSVNGECAREKKLKCYASSVWGMPLQNLPGKFFCRSDLTLYL